MATAPAPGAGRAVSNAGGLGSIAEGAMNAADARAAIRQDPNSPTATLQRQLSSNVTARR